MITNRREEIELLCRVCFTINHDFPCSELIPDHKDEHLGMCGSHER